jgi:transposase InsO family protein
VDCDVDTELLEALVSHRNAPLSETGRLRLARCVVDEGWPLRRAAERFQVAVSTAQRWAGRYRQHGAVGMADRSSRPHCSSGRTPVRVERRIIKVRLLRRWGPARIGSLLGVAPSTVHRVLTRHHLARLAHLDRGTGRVIRRYEHDAPGDLVHVDIKKLGNIPDGGGHKVHGRVIGGRNSAAHRNPHRARRVGGRPNLGYSYLHNAVDDHSRLAYTEILPDETKHTAAGFWERAHAWFTAHGIDRIHRVLTDNGACYRSAAWHDALTTTGTRHLRTRAYRPQTNGKVERFNRTLLDEWAYAQPYTSETQRRAALPDFLHRYNHHRHHTSIGGPPAKRVPNLTGQNI